MSGGLFTNMLLRETGLEINSERIQRLQQLHAAAYNRHVTEVRALPGAGALLASLTQAGVHRPSPPAAGWRRPAALEVLRVEPSRAILVTHDQASSIGAGLARRAARHHYIYGEQSAAHANLAMDAPDRKLDAFAIERFTPG